ncbi:MAG: EscR/YscR/HrcR family type III secretion system export apparatus protein [Oscillospiraceae bacterium]|nr:EscR/YscR/HrcR family type III secretion system export apparatus protein [Oscillospiraceae bacterium]
MIKEAVRQNGKLFLRFFVSLVLTIFLAAVLCVTAGALSAAEPGSSQETQILTENPEAEAVTDESLMHEVFGIDGSQTLEIILIITILSVAPSFLVMVTSFTRIVIVFSFLRNAMQTQSIPPNSVLTGLSLFLTLFIMWPTFVSINDNAYQPYAKGEIDITEMAGRAGDELKVFMLKNTSKDNMQFFVDMAGATIYAPAADEAAQADAAQTESQEEPFIKDILGRDEVKLTETEAVLTDFTDQLGLEMVIPAFIVSELTRAFQMGFLLFIPFLVIDIVISSTLMAMGMMMLPPSMISMPFKIMLFVLVDGWQLLTGTIVTSFNI